MLFRADNSCQWVVFVFCFVPITNWLPNISKMIFVFVFVSDSCHIIILCEELLPYFYYNLGKRYPRQKHGKHQISLVTFYCVVSQNAEEY